MGFEEVPQKKLEVVSPRDLEIVLLPGNTDTAFGEDKAVGKHTVVVSGFFDHDLRAYRNDDDVRHFRYILDIDKLLWDPGFLQASTMTSWGEIYSHDSDEVDHSGWGIRSVETGHTDVALSISGPKPIAVRKLRLRISVSVQGDENTWRRIGFQTVANGTLLNVQEVRPAVNRTEEIKVPPDEA